MARGAVRRVPGVLLIAVAGTASAELLLARAAPPALLTVGLAAPRASGWLPGAYRPRPGTDAWLVLGARLVAHGASDRSFTESLRLAAAAPGRARLVILETFDHTGPLTGPRGAWAWLGAAARDVWGLFRLADDLLQP